MNWDLGVEQSAANVSMVSEKANAGFISGVVTSLLINGNEVGATGARNRCREDADDDENNGIAIITSSAASIPMRITELRSKRREPDRG